MYRISTSFTRRTNGNIDEITGALLNLTNRAMNDSKSLRGTDFEINGSKLKDHLKIVTVHLGISVK